MKTTFVSLLCAVCTALFTSHGSAAEAVKHVDVKGAAKLMQDKKDVVVLDIRRDVEFEEGHIDGAKNIDFYSKDFAESLKTLDRDKAYLVHCASGGRSTKSLATFKALGFKQVYHLDGGFNAWKEAGKPVAK